MRDAAKRIAEVLKFIHTHLDEPLPVAQLAGQACVSPHHFHRVFSQLCGVGLASYVRQQRVLKAANMLLFRQQYQVLDIALESGFNSAEVFTRAFKSVTGLTPSAFKQSSDWQVFHTLSTRLVKVEQSFMRERDYSVALVDMPSVPVAIWLHQGPAPTLMKSIQSFIQWRKDSGLSPKTHRTFNIVYDDPSSTEPQDYRFGLVSEVRAQDEMSVADVTVDRLFGGLCAHVRHVGPDHGLDAIVAYLYGSWIVSQPFELTEAPLIMERVRFFPDVQATEAITDIYLPVKPE